MNEMLRAVVTEGTARRAQFGSFEIAGKTGTSQDYRDAWFIGYSSQMVAGVWVGNDDNTPTKKVTGGSIPAAIWKDVMELAHEALIPQPLPGNIEDSTVISEQIGESDLTVADRQPRESGFLEDLGNLFTGSSSDQSADGAAKKKRQTNFERMKQQQNNK